MQRRFSITTELAVPADELWRSVCTFEGVNYELGPWLRMTMPRGLGGRTIGEVEAGERLGKSWLLLGGLVPVDYDDLGIAELDPPRRFLERSRMLSMSSWEHERVVAPVGEGSAAISDHLAFALRRPLAAVPGSGGIAARIVGATFRHRHRRLVARHGVAKPR